MDNVLLTYNNIELYQSEIDILCDDYLNMLHDKSMIYKSTVFSGLLQYIYNNKLKYIIPQKYNHDYKLLDDIFYSVYINLCTRFNICPTIIQFTVLCHFDQSLLSKIKSGVYFDGSKVKPDTFHTVKKWYDTCESMLLSKATNENSIGSIFALKANYGYRDNDNTKILAIQTEAQATPEQIKELYKDIAKPPLPDLLGDAELTDNTQNFSE